jgi:hypothetical protein
MDGKSAVRDEYGQQQENRKGQHKDSNYMRLIVLHHIYRLKDRR